MVSLAVDGLILLFLFLFRIQVIAVTNNQRRSDQCQDTQPNQGPRPPAGPAPLMECDPPQVAEYDNERHVNRPAGEVKLRAQLRLPHTQMLLQY